MADLLDIVAVGAGPSNLSLAALAAPVARLRLALLERKPELRWHPGMMLFEAQLQTAHVKDLVTLVDPTSPFSFLNFLSKHQRLYRFLVASRAHVCRREFQQYLAWVARQLDCVRFGADVEAVSHDGKSFVVEGAEGALRARNVVVGVGPSPDVPACAAALLSQRVFHSSTFVCSQGRVTAGKDVLLVGGGQSAAEIALDLLSDLDRLPRRLVWVTSRVGLQPMDDSPFTNEWFNPRYAAHFHHLDPARRLELLERQVLASDGVSESLLLAIYRRLYVLDYLEQRAFSHELLADHRLTALRPAGARYHATVESRDLGTAVAVDADVVILATGYREGARQVLAPLQGRIQLEDGNCKVNADFSLAWDGPADQRVFVQGAARHAHGVADPNLSLVAWRSAVILNSVCGRTVYPVAQEGITLALRDMRGAGREPAQGGAELSPRNAPRDVGAYAD